ncbi:TRM11 family SAM-dependent methyltransferase [Zavarzinia sp. CC-PAN008]|uniref:TRM11 family SAM-dependent methyltransferase n=1 Tax=Zavarzinia sp. CC-PAN008 TaxID=3243332 RepID=UPI003F74479F
MGRRNTVTIQSQLEQTSASTKRRQSTRYSVHGLHEYRGKFNPQVSRALINILGVPAGGLLLDPFCGSGTTLVEAAHRGVRGIGLDLNPLAVFIANAKLAALTTPVCELKSALDRIRTREMEVSLDSVQNPRQQYLASWFEAHILAQIERLRIAIEEEETSISSFFLTVASNLLRDFSLQDPADLRIRRRSSANATSSFATAFNTAALDVIKKLAAAQEVVGVSLLTGRAILKDNRLFGVGEQQEKADAAVTSPPYATALPYIDTQRLSLVWLRLLTPEQIGAVEAELTGSREISSKAKRQTLEALLDNKWQLPAPEVKLCQDLQEALTDADGFRRQAVPVLLYRYFHSMLQSFQSIARSMKSGAPFALIVGHNHTVLSGSRFEINTPQHLASLAEEAGWSVSEMTSLQTYQRFGLHASNAVKSETLLILRAP